VALDERTGTDSEGNRFITALKQRWWLVAVTCLAAALIAFALTARNPAVYTATALLKFSDTDIEDQIAGNTFSSRPTDEAGATNVVLVSRRPVAAEASRRLGGALDPDELLKRLSITHEDLTSIVKINADDDKPSRAAKIANVYAQTYVDIDRADLQRRLTQALGVVNRQLSSLTPSQRRGPQGQALADRQTQLALLKDTGAGRVEVVQAATPPQDPSSTSPLRNALLAGLLGLVLGLALVALREQGDRRVRTETDLERAYGVPILASLPRSRALRAGHQFLGDLPAADAEVFRLLQAQLRYSNELGEVHSVVVTSATNSEGKTTSAWGLAAAAAATGSRVLLLEADMRRPTLAERYGLEGEEGLIDVLEGQLELDEAVQEVEVASGRDLHVVVAGPSSVNPADLAQSARVPDVMRAATEAYELVVIDTPPLSVVSDAIPFAKLADGVIVVSQNARVTPKQIARLRDQLRSLDTRLLGIVANGFDAERDTRYAYY
jgi:capsular exopolysaccharide synthesis family protein